jgi:hypothetical protein
VTTTATSSRRTSGARTAAQRLDQRAEPFLARGERHGAPSAAHCAHRPPATTEGNEQRGERQTSAAVRGRQYWNRDTGYGVCHRCFVWIAKREGFTQARRCYGRPGFHHSIPGEAEQ